LRSDQAAAHLLDVGVAAALTSELDTTDDAGDVAITLDLVEEETLFVFKVLVALAAVVMVRRDDLVLLHVFDGVEEGLAADDGAGDLGGMDVFGHGDRVLRVEGLRRRVGEGGSRDGKLG
jgi:hypothetical protein